MDWAKVLGGLPKYLGLYAKSFAAAGFSKQADLYIASGLLSYNASAEMNNMLDFLRPYSRTVQVGGCRRGWRARARGRGGGGVVLHAGGGGALLAATSLW